LIWESRDGSAITLLNSADATLDFWDVLTRDAGVEDDVIREKGGVEGLEFRVRMDGGHVEPAGSVDLFEVTEF
jgi:hypothetical protein